MRYAIAKFKEEQEAVAFRLYIADAVNYGLGKPLRVSLKDILYPPKEVDAEKLTEEIAKKAGITIKS
jgi:hypothetical protein